MSQKFENGEGTRSVRRNQHPVPGTHRVRCRTGGHRPAGNEAIERVVVGLPPLAAVTPGALRRSCIGALLAKPARQIASPSRPVPDVGWCLSWLPLANSLLGPGPTHEAIQQPQPASSVAAHDRVMRYAGCWGLPAELLSHYLLLSVFPLLWWGIVAWSRMDQRKSQTGTVLASASSLHPRLL